MKRYSRFNLRSNVGWLWDFSWSSWTFGIWWGRELRTKIGVDLGPFTIMYKTP